MDKEIEIPEINSLSGQLTEIQLSYKVKHMPSHLCLELIHTLLEIWLQVCVCWIYFFLPLLNFTFKGIQRL